MPSAMIITLSKLRNIESNLHWKTLPATAALNGILVNRKQPILVLKVVR